MKKRLLGLILAVLMILPSTMNAYGEEGSTSTSEKENQEVKPPEAPAPTPGLLMSLLGKAGLAKPLDKVGINLYGYVQGGFFYD
ncbi:MAG TPA: hypothetical protein VMV04_05915, partial [Thermodesulfobacteriota bacterium]|nr:hypothetical protein [Thermodesulfobacteriota bacterium]